MKPSRNPFLRSASLAASLFGAFIRPGLPSAIATTYYWDRAATSGAGDGTSNPGANGNWDTSTTNWDDGTNHIAWPNTLTITDIAAFAGTARTVTVSTVNVGTLEVRSGYTFNSGTITFSDGIIDIAQDYSSRPGRRYIQLESGRLADLQGDE